MRRTQEMLKTGKAIFSFTTSRRSSEVLNLFTMSSRSKFQRATTTTTKLSSSSGVGAVDESLQLVRHPLETSPIATLEKPPAANLKEKEKKEDVKDDDNDSKCRYYDVGSCAVLRPKQQSVAT